MIASERMPRGRSKGKNRELPELATHCHPNGEIQSAPQGDRARYLKEMCILSRNDWNRIQMQLNQRHVEDERIKAMQQEKIEKHERSLAETKNWSNTIAGQRQKKLEARKIREAKEEEEKKIIDIEEAKYQAEKRKEAIEKAKTQQYYQTDRVKRFHSALQLTEVLKERDVQLELKKLREASSAGKDRDWLMLAQREYEEGVQRDQMQALERNTKSRDIAKFQQEQCNQQLKHLRMKNEEDIIEGEELKRLNAQNLIEKKKLNEIRKQEASQLMQENLKQIDDVYRTKKMRERQEEEEDEECRIFAAAKRKMMKLRAEKERQLHDEKQEHLEGIKRILHAQNLQKIDNEDERIRRAVEEADKRQDMEDYAKEHKSSKAYAEIAKHRHEHMKKREWEKLQEKKKEKEMLAMKREIDAQFSKNEQEKSSKKMAEAKQFTDFQLRQVDERRGKEHAARIEQLAHDAHNVKLIGFEEEQFQEYAQDVIQKSEKGGRNVYPLKKAAQEGAGGGLGPLFLGKGGVRPSYMSCDQHGVQLPNYQRGTTEDVKQLVQGEGNTDQRLGFVW